MDCNGQIGCTNMEGINLLCNDSEAGADPSTDIRSRFDTSHEDFKCEIIKLIDPWAGYTVNKSTTTSSSIAQVEYFILQKHQM